MRENFGSVPVCGCESARRRSIAVAQGLYWHQIYGSIVWETMARAVCYAVVFVYLSIYLFICIYLLIFFICLFFSFFSSFSFVSTGTSTGPIDICIML